MTSRGPYAGETLAAHVRALLDVHREPIPDDATGYMRSMFPPEDLLDRLRARYEDELVPPCRVCGGQLTLSSAGGGNAATYACPRPDDVSFSDWDRHYRDSKYTHTRPGDADVMALVDLVESLLADPAPEDTHDVATR